MEDIIHYLELKNQFYGKFLALTSKFLGKTADNQWDDLELFMDNRERVLNIIRSFDFRIAKSFEELDLSKVNLDDYRDQVKSFLDERKAIVDQIVKIDLELVSRIDDLKSETIRELKRAVKTSQHVESFDTRPTVREKTVKTA